MKKVMQAVSITIFFIICMAGCGKEEQGGEIIQERERTEYDLAGNSWKEFDEVAESRESWGIANYWEDSELGAPEEGMTIWGYQSSVDGTDYYILQEYETADGNYRRYLTRVDTVTFEAERKEIVISGEADEKVGLAKAIEEYGALVAGMDVIDGRPCLLLFRMDEEKKEIGHIYKVQMNADLETESIVDIKKDLENAGLLSGRSGVGDIFCDRSGNTYIGASEVAVFDKEGSFIKKLEPPKGFDGIFARTCRLPDGRPVFECIDVASDRSALFCLEGTEEKILYDGKYNYSAFRCLNEYGEIYYVGGRSVYRWDAADGSCERLYQDMSMDVYGCRAIIESPEGALTLAFYADGESYLYQLKQGKQEEETEITIFQLHTDQMIEKSADEYSRKHPGVRITVEGIQEGEDRDIALNRVMAQIQEGNGPDMFVVAKKHLEILQNQGLLMDLSMLRQEDVFDQMFQGVLQYGMVDGKLYGIVSSASVGTLVVNESIWDKETWTAEDVMKLMEEGGESGNDFSTFNQDAISSGDLLYQLAVKDIIAGNSSLVNEEEKSCQLDGERFINILKFCREYGKDSESSEEGIEKIHSRENLAFAAGSNLAAFSRDMKALGEGYRVVGFPTDGGYGGYVSCGDCFAISGTTKNQEKALDFIKYLLGDKVQKKNGIYTVRRDILVDNIVEGEEDGEGPFLMVGNRSITLLEGRPDGKSFLPEYLEIMERGSSIDTQTRGISAIIMEEAGAFFHGDKSAEDAAKVIQNRVWLYLNE